MSSSPETGDQRETIEEDIRLIVGGKFTPDSVGSEVYDEVWTRALSQSSAYLDVFEDLFVGVNFDPLAQIRQYIPTFLRRLAAEEPARVEEITKQLLKQYEAILVVYDSAPEKAELFQLLPEETVRLMQRLNQWRDDLNRLLEEL